MYGLLCAKNGGFDAAQRLQDFVSIEMGSSDHVYGSLSQEGASLMFTMEPIFIASSGGYDRDKVLALRQEFPQLMRRADRRHLVIIQSAVQEELGGWKPFPQWRCTALVKFLRGYLKGVADTGRLFELRDPDFGFVEFQEAIRVAIENAHKCALEAVDDEWSDKSMSESDDDSYDPRDDFREVVAALGAETGTWYAQQKMAQFNQQMAVARPIPHPTPPPHVRP